MIPGVFMGHRLVPVESAGAYVPAGRYPCLTSAVMSLAPAKVAGVKRLVTCSSPGRDKRLNPAILYTMAKIGADEIYCLGVHRRLRLWLLAPKPSALSISWLDRATSTSLRPNVKSTAPLDLIFWPDQRMHGDC